MGSSLGLTKRKKAENYIAERINAANSEAVKRLYSVEPTLIDVQTALAVIPGMTKLTVLHAGPPVEWGKMCDPMKRAIRGALIFEGVANDDDGAERLVRKNKINLAPNHHHDSVGPMTGIISASMPVIVTIDSTNKKRVFSTFNEGGGSVLWFGSFTSQTLERLRWMRDIFGPVIKKVLDKAGGISIWNVLAQGIQMGDECHNRHASCTNLFLKSIVEPLFSLGLSRVHSLQVYRFIAENSHFFLNITMTACKLAMDEAHDVKDSTVVTAMSRNGTDFAIRVSGLGNRWFIAPSPYLEDALYNPAYDRKDAARDIGDSSIIETMGLGGFAIAAAPAMASFAGGAFHDAVVITREMGQITIAKNQKFAIPTLNYEGTPTGIDIRKVVETGILPRINSAVIHKSSGAGQIGAGIAKAPYKCFSKALMAFGKKNRLGA